MIPAGRQQPAGLFFGFNPVYAQDRFAVMP
jgi:hypothetical protein